MSVYKNIMTGEVREIADAMRRDFNPGDHNNQIGKTVFLVGAGCSRSAGIPLATEIAKDLVIDLAIRYSLVAKNASDPDLALMALVDSGRINSIDVFKRDGSGEAYTDWSSVYEIVFSAHYCTPKKFKEYFLLFLIRMNPI